MGEEVEILLRGIAGGLMLVGLLAICISTQFVVAFSCIGISILISLLTTVVKEITNNE